MVDLTGLPCGESQLVPPIGWGQFDEEEGDSTHPTRGPGQQSS